MTNQPNDVNREAARKMAIVDALSPEDRRKVWDIGLYAFSEKHQNRYAKAKARAGIKGRCAFTQTRAVAKAAAKKAA